MRFVFLQVKDKEKVCTRKSFAVYTIIGVFGLIITELGMVGLVSVIPEFSLFGSTEFFAVTWAKWLSKIIMTWIVLVWNYIGRKLFVFKS